ncbi:hypothetical protein [Paenibacillus gansuensis]|uniref:Uncharacterized protein n=1 Tax=Paenibacillus gansuensis TaxID=306542 RepID=A0ABW5PGX5_9BACL
MSKNQKVIISSVGVLLALILAVLMIRSPVEKQIASDPPPKQVVTPAPQETTPPKEMDDSHEKVAGLIDDASAAVMKEAPGLWGRVTESWNWFMGFDAKHAIILIGVMVFVVGILVSGNHRGGGKRNQH